MRITKLYIKSFKNLQNFTWELNPEYPVAVIVGKNASGKSNLLEAILMIFIEAQKNTKNKFENFPFEFELNYQLGETEIANVFLQYNGVLYCEKNQKAIDPVDVLPDKIVSFYSGISQRMKHLVREYLVDKKNPNRNFNITLTETIHFKFAILTLLISLLERHKKDLLAEQYSIVEFLSFSLKIQKPSYLLAKEVKKDNFWAAPPNLSQFFNELLKNKSWETVSTDEYNIGLSDKGLDTVMRSTIINGFEDNFFDLLSQSYSQGYIQDIDIRFKKKNIEQALTFEDLSEGEKQIIGIRGTIELLMGNETLFLLDEPDAFAHPRWQWQFVPDMQKTLGDSLSTQVIFVTHSPLVLSTIKDNAFVMEDGKIEPLYGIYGEDVGMSLARMDTDDRLKDVDDKIALYKAMIQDGNMHTERAKQLKVELVEELGINHSAIIELSPLETLYE